MTKRSIILSIIFASVLMLQACGDVLTPATPASTEEEVAVQEESKASVSEASVSETSASEAQEEYYYGDYKELSVGDRAPWFSAEIVSGSDTVFEMADMQGKVILINFWATWCPPCVREMPAFDMLFSDYKDSDEVAIVAVDVCEDRKTVDKFVYDNGYMFPIAYDEEGNIGLQYPTDGIPYTVIVGKDGYIKNIHLGAMDAETQYKEYKADIEAALAE